MSDKVLNNLRIKTGVVRRLNKEMQSYEKEVERELQRLEKMKATGEDEYRTRKQEEVIQETRNMVPSCRVQLQKACSELKNLVGEAHQEHAETEIFKNANEMLMQICGPAGDS